MKTYMGGCHCGAVRYKVETDLVKVISCNCSHCAKKGMLLAFVPSEQFRLLSGEDNLTDYQFNKKIIHHLFCSTCGVQSFSRGAGKDGKEMVGINVRCLDDVDVESLMLTPFDGKSW
ncbi:MAG: aldehyde-activating protein [Candidatus Ryanbacteria bacterium RIFCSPHIGHO2_02_FULL_48_12]|uniref:Aldehyde-activating protein n=1 Tax=Candidatus Ryanbacteria bacterium RIFCSPHIGHO2_01_FULL_48_27 TaxID=1802115 RepID=A0A1G2G4S6_9BACT|nr:MAG: aldehyde-activating protein [Candidatus Ryanbacteria bacterium RIFCSPHIGHO2_01_FULL_48_27]OGZ49095.1 MAG: aldehyde-activating protein [Candidatus Ryanbacteria bacterium RIFCSPHIGHO2_02_FULL_48_12]